MAETRANRPTLISEGNIEAGNPKANNKSSLARYWNQAVDTAYADIVCLLLCLITGLCDSSAYNAWSCFLGMQTSQSMSSMPFKQG
jgi:hypothetical protein